MGRDARSAGVVGSEVAAKTMREHFAQPFAVTAHAVQRYRTRVDPTASRDEAIAELQRALQAPAFERPARDGATLYGCRDRFGRRIGILVTPPREASGWPVVVTVGGWLLWQEYKAEWEQMYREFPRRSAEESQAEPTATQRAAEESQAKPTTTQRSAEESQAKPTTTKQRRQAKGLCVGCGRVAPEVGHTRCAECRARHALAVKALRARRAAQGKCPRCGREVADGEKRCQVCRAKDQARPKRPQRATAKPSPYRQNQIDFISRYSGVRSLEWIAERLRVSPRTVANIIDQEGLGPTTRGDYLTSGQAAELLSYSPQWVTTLCRTGRLPARRNPTSRYPGRWWLIPREAVQRWLASNGQQSADVRLTEPSAWPRAIPRQPWRRKRQAIPIPHLSRR